MKRLILVAGASLCLLLPSSCGKRESNPAGTSKQPQAQWPEVPPTQSGSQVALDRIYIDSVPSGAEVILYQPETATRPGEEPREKETPLGQTPLTATVKPGKLKIHVRMSVEEYLNAIAQIPSLASWSKRYEEQQRMEMISGMGGYGSVGPGMMSHWFEFDTASSQLLTDVSGRLTAIGPVYEITFPEENRVCAIFLPRGHPVSVLFPVMPPPAGRFPVFDEGWRRVLINEYSFSEAQATEALESLSRVGKAYTVRRGPAAAQEEVISITVQGPPLQTVATHGFSRPVMPVP